MFPSPRAPPPYINSGGYSKRMRLPWQRNRKAEVAATKPRTESGQFVAQGMAPQAQSVVKQVQNEQMAMTGTLGVMEGATKLFEIVDNLAQKRAEQMVGEEAVEEFGGEWMPLIQMGMQIFGPALVPYVPGIMEKLGIQPSNPSEVKPAEAGAVSTGSSQGNPAEPVKGIGNYIAMAAQAHKVPGGMTALKKALPTAFEEMEKQGLKEETFKQAVRNINKAIG